MSNLTAFLISLIVLTTILHCSQCKLVATKPIKISGTGEEIKAKEFHFDESESALMPWFDAMEFCQMRGLEPARVESAEENNIVATALNDYFQTSRVFWLGASDWGQDGRFYWIRTGEEFQFQNFAAGYPNGGLPESCAYVWGDGLWYDQYCSVQDVRPLCQRVF